ncbi:MAG: hypothetical protein ACTTHM_07505 [Peptoanaerobacter stomatis]|uniref:hypothetical protein n=1 Tax=Peptoanaerobacter stomatis TaxID=796937 RepID=UPI003FA14690
MDKSLQKLIRAFSSSEDEKDTDYIQEQERIKKLTEEYLLNDNNPEKISILKDYKAGASLTGENGIRKRLSAIDLGYFGRAYFPHYFSRKSPTFHNELDEIWTGGVLKRVNPYTKRNAKMINTKDGVKRSVAAPRGHAKSTNLTFKDDIHAILYEYKHYILILSDTYDQASSFVAAIKEELEENYAIIEDFGNLTGKIWREDVITTKTNIKVQAKGAGQKVRGLKHKNWRPDLIVLDDVENDELVRTVEQRRKLENWFYKAVSKCGDTYTDFIYIGTMLHYDSLLAKVMKNPMYKSIKYKAVMEFSKSDLWDRWEEIFTNLDDDNKEQSADEFFKKNKEEMLKGTKVLWEEKLSYYDLRKMRVS